MNIFLGLPISQHVVDELVQITLKNYPHLRVHPAVRWTLADNNHITMHFFGPIPLDKIAPVISALTRELQSVTAFSVQLEQIAPFPKPNAKLIAAYVKLNPPLTKLYQMIEKVIVESQFSAEDRPYLPHITLCRMRKSLGLLEGIILPDFSIDIRELVLYQSQPSSAGSEYIPLQHWKLKKMLDY